MTFENRGRKLIVKLQSEVFLEHVKNQVSVGESIYNIMGTPL